MTEAFTLIVLTLGAGANAPPSVAMHSLPSRQACERAAVAVERLMGMAWRRSGGFGNRVRDGLNTARECRKRRPWSTST